MDLYSDLGYCQLTLVESIWNSAKPVPSQTGDLLSAVQI